MAKPKLEDMMGAMGAEPAEGGDLMAAEPKPDQGDVSDEEMGFAEDMGFDARQAGALKRFIKSCLASEEAGEYEEPEEPAEAEELGGM